MTCDNMAIDDDDLGAVLQSRVPESLAWLWHALVDEPQGKLLGYAPTESLWGHLKVGGLHGRKFATLRQAMDEVVAWLTFYNYRRLHSSLGYLSPVQYEQRWHAAQHKNAA